MDLLPWMAPIHNAFATRLLAELLGHEVDSGLLLKEERPNNNPQTLHVKCAIVLGKEVVNFPKKILEEDIPPPLWKVISEYMCPWTLLKLGGEFLTRKGVNVAECWRNHYNRRWPWKYGRSALDLLDRHNLTHRQLYIDRHFMKLLEEYYRMYPFGQLKANHPERILSHDLMWCSVNEYDPKVPCYLPKKVQATMKKDTMGSRVLALAKHVTSLTLNASLSLFLEDHWELVMELLESVELLRIQCYPTVTESNCCWNIIETFLRHGKLQEFSLTFAKCSDGFVDLFERLMTICAGLDHSDTVSSNDLSFDCDISGCSDDIFDVSLDQMGQSVEKKLRGHQSENLYFCTDSCSSFRQSCYRSFKRPSTSSLFENSDDKDEETESYVNKDEVVHYDTNGSTYDACPCPKHAVNFSNTRQILSENELDANRPGVPLRCKKFCRNLSSYLSKSQSGSASETNLLNSMLRHQRLSSHSPSSFRHSHCHTNLEASPKSRKCWKSSINWFDSKNCPQSENVNCLSQAKLDGGCCCRLYECPTQTGKFSKLCPYWTKEDNFPYLSTTRLHSMKYETKRKTSFSVLTALLSNSYDELAEVKQLKPSDRHRYYRPLGKLHNHSSSSANAGTTSGHSGSNGVTQWSESNMQGILCEQENLSNCCMKPEKNKPENRTFSLFDSTATTSSSITTPPNSPNTSDFNPAMPPTQNFKHEESTVSLANKWERPQNSKDTEASNLQSLLDSINGEDQQPDKLESNFKNPNGLSNRKRRHSGGKEAGATRRGSAAADTSPTPKPKNHDKRRVSFDIYADLDDNFSSKSRSATDDPDVLQRGADSPDSGCRLQSPTLSQQNSPNSTPKSCKSDSSLWDLCLGLTKSNSGAYISKATHGLKSLRIIGDPAPHIGYVLRDILPMWPALQKLYLNVTGLNNPKLLDVIGDLLDKKQLKDLSIIGCETEDGVFRRALQCLHNSYRDDGEKNGLNLLNIQSFADPSITCSATLPPAEPLYGVKNLILRDNIFDLFGVSGLLRIIEFDNALIKLNLKCSYLHAWMGQLLAAIARKGQIEELYLGSNQIEGSHSELELIKVLNQCKNLKRLDLRSCSLRSQVVSSENFISAIRNHKSLEFLCLKGNRLGITILTLIDKLHDKKEPFNLKSLNVSGNPFNVERYGVDTLLKTYRCQPRVPWLLELKMKACFQISTREREADVYDYVGKWVSAFAKHVSFNIEVSSSGMRFVEYADANSVVYM